MRHRQSSKTGPSVGLEITSTDLRAVELKLHGRETVIQRLAQIEAPEGSVRGGRVVEPAALADGLRRLWGKGGFSTRRCAVAVPAGALTQQMLTVPPAPAAEQRLIVRGELARFAPENEYAPFGWMPMASQPGRTPSPMRASTIFSPKCWAGVTPGRSSSSRCWRSADPTNPRRPSTVCNCRPNSSTTGRRMEWPTRTGRNAALCCSWARCAQYSGSS